MADEAKSAVSASHNSGESDKHTIRSIASSLCKRIDVGTAILPKPLFSEWLKRFKHRVHLEIRPLGLGPESITHHPIGREHDDQASLLGRVVDGVQPRQTRPTRQTRKRQCECPSASDKFTTIGIFDHLFLDVLTLSGVALFWPLKFKIKGFVKSGSWVEDVIFVVLFLYKLLKPVNQYYALLMALFLLLAVPITLINELFHVAVLVLLNSAEPSHSLVSLFLELHEHGIFVSQIFWGLWLFPMGYLVFRSGFLPKFLGVLLIIGCPG